MKTTDFRNTMRELMNTAWRFVKENGLTMSSAMKQAWAIVKLKAAMKTRVVKFHYYKVDGTIREAYGTLLDRLLPPTKGVRKANPIVQVYYDTEKHEYRCFRKANLVVA